MGIVNEYFVENRLIKYWEFNSLKKMHKKDMDKVYIVDGRERLGKSWFTIQQACAIDPSMLESPEKFVSRICFSAEEFRETVKNTQNGVIIFDEAFRGLASRSTMSRTNKAIIQVLMEMGQNNNIVFIVLPSFFMLDIYPAMLRSDGLFHIYEEMRSGKRAWKFYNKRDKNKLYQAGMKKGWGYIINSRIRGRFYGKFPNGDVFKDAYLAKKKKALNSMLTETKTPSLDTKGLNNLEKLRVALVDMGWTYEKIATIEGVAKARIGETMSKVRTKCNI